MRRARPSIASSHARHLSGQSLPALQAVRARGRSARGDREARRGSRGRTRVPDAARRDGLGQDVHDGERHRADRPAGARPRAQQDARRAALLRVPRVLSAQRRRVFRLVLRLLPARGVRSVARPLHREGQLDQRAHRADAPLGDEGDPRAPGLRDRRDGLRDLRHRRPVRVPQHDPAREGGRSAQPARRHQAADRDAVHAQRSGFPARNLSRARRRDRHLPGRARRERRAHRAVRRHGRVDAPLRSADRPHPDADRALHRVPVEPLRDGPAEGARRDREDQGRARRDEGPVRRADEARRGAADRAADAVRPRDDDRDRLLQGDRELFAPPVGTRGGRAAADVDRLSAVALADVRRREPRDDPAGRRDVSRRPRAQGEPRQLRLPAALRARQPAAALRRVRAAAAADDVHLGDAGRVRAHAFGPGRRAARAADGARRSGGSRSGPRRRRSTISSPRSRCASVARSACSSPRSPSGWPRTSPII